jgi:hypothetical protein
VLGFFLCLVRRRWWSFCFSLLLFLRSCHLVFFLLYKKNMPISESSSTIS